MHLKARALIFLAGSLVGATVGLTLRAQSPNAVAAQGAAPAREPAIALVGGTLINPGAVKVPRAVIVMRGGRIVCAGARCPVPTGARRVDVTGKFITPGLVDAHVHYSQTGWVDGRPDALDVRAEFPYDSIVASLRDTPERFDRAFLCSGITAVFDVGGYSWSYDLARRNQRSTMAPRVAAAGPLLSTIDHWVNLPGMRQFVHMRDDSTVRAAVRSNAALGASAIKVWYLQLPESVQVRMRPLLVLAGDEARRLKRPLIVHATQLGTAKDALRAGATVLVHSVETAEVDSEFVSLALRNHAIVIPTLTVREGYADVYLGRSPALRYPLECVDRATRAKIERVLPEERRVRGSERVRSGAWDEQRRTMDRNLIRMRDAGVAIAVGTDAGNPGTAAGPSIFREMEAMQSAGMTAAEVLASATVIGARAMGAANDVGVAEAGKVADLAVFEADPSLDIRNARQLVMVVRNGVVHRKPQLLPQ